MTKLVAFYSRAGENYFKSSIKNIEIGNTEKIARMIAEVTKADYFKIEQMVPYSNNYETCTIEAKKDLQANARPELLNILKSINEYDEIYLGYPNYWGTMPMAVYTFLEAFDFTGKKIYPFCTHEGSGLSNTLNDIKNIAKGAIVEKGLSVYGSEVDESMIKAREWIQNGI